MTTRRISCSSLHRKGIPAGRWAQARDSTITGGSARSRGSSVIFATKVVAIMIGAGMWILRVCHDRRPSRNT